MSDNPYSPPGSKLAERSVLQRRPLWLAALAGLAVDILGTFITGTLVAIVLGAALNISDPAALQAALTSPPWTAFNFIVGMACTALGGYAAARLANQRELLCGLVVGLLSLVTGEVMLAFADDYEVWLRIASVIVVIPVAIAGGWLRKQQRRKARVLGHLSK